MTVPKLACLLSVMACVMALSACVEGRTRHDDIRSGCIAAANTHRLATQRATLGQIPPQQFAEIDEAWDGIAYVCREAIAGRLPADPATEKSVDGFNARYGDPT